MTIKASAIRLQLSLEFLVVGDDQRLLNESLEEEKQADASLTKIATSEINYDAVAA
jgi:hypothetical protein